MATNYPGSLDAFTNPAATDEMDDAGVEHDVQHSDVNDAIEAVQAKLGTGASDASGAGVLDVLAADGAGGTTWQPLSHGALSDLGDVSDHPDYATLDGSRAFTGSVEIPDGALSELSLRFVGNTNTGIFLENGTDLAVMADGVVQFRVESDRVSSEATFDIVESGSAASPALDFFNGNTGFFIPGFDMGVTVQGVEMARFVDGVGFQISVDGSAAAPSLAFTSDPDTGFYTQNSSHLGIAWAGADSAIFDADGIKVGDGAAGGPSVSFISDTDTGMYLKSAGTFGFTAGGFEVASLDDLGVFTVTDLRASDGSATSPSIGFDRDQNTGLYLDRTNAAVVTAIGGAPALRVLDHGLTIGDDLIYSAGDTDVNMLNFLVETNGSGATNGISFFENVSGFHMSIGYDGTGSGDNNKIVVYDSGDGAMFEFTNGADFRRTGEVWTDVSFVNGWSNYGSPYAPAQYYKSPDGMVHMRGLISGGTENADAFFLPAGYRPLDGHHIFACFANDAAVRVQVETGGAVNVTNQGGGNPASYVDLSTIHFAAF